MNWEKLRNILKLSWINTLLYILCIFIIWIADFISIFVETDSNGYVLPDSIKLFNSTFILLFLGLIIIFILTIISLIFFLMANHFYKNNNLNELFSLHLKNHRKISIIFLSICIVFLITHLSNFVISYNYSFNEIGSYNDITIIYYLWLFLGVILFAITPTFMFCNYYFMRDLIFTYNSKKIKFKKKYDNDLHYFGNVDKVYPYLLDKNLYLQWSICFFIIGFILFFGTYIEFSISYPFIPAPWLAFYIYHRNKTNKFIANQIERISNIEIEDNELINYQNKIINGTVYQKYINFKKFCLRCRMIYLSNNK